MKFYQNDIYLHSYQLRKLQGASANRAENIRNCLPVKFLSEGNWFSAIVFYFVQTFMEVTVFNVGG
jgi:hypothetical protein